MDFFSIPLVATAISIIICWALYAIFCSNIHEAITLSRGERGRFMKKWLLKQLYDHPNGVNWASMIYLHGAIDLLTRASNKPTSDIAPRLFAETLVEVVGEAQLVQMHKALLDKPDPIHPDKKLLPYSSEVLNNFKAATLVLKPSDVVSFYQKALKTAELRAGNGAKPDESEIYNCLVNQIEEWYHQMEQQLSAWYKKKTRYRLFWLGFVIALVINVDSVQFYQHFRGDPASRRVMMNFYEKNAETLEEMAKTDTLSKDSLISEIRIYGERMDSLSRAAVLPVGWEYSILNAKVWDKDPHLSTFSRRAYKEPGRDASGWTKFRSWWGKIWSIFMLRLKQFFGATWFLFIPKLPGLMITGLAASFGGPFWFDVLKKMYKHKNPIKQ